MKTKTWKLYLVLIVVIITIAIIGCSNYDAAKLNNNNELEVVDKLHINDEMILSNLNEIVSIDCGDDTFHAYSSELVDVYLICATLFFDFESSNFIDTDYGLGEEMKEYFAEHREDAFIKKFSKYVDVQTQDINFTVLGTMFDYLYAKNVEDSPMTNLQNNVFRNYGEFEAFILELEAFAKRSNISEFIEGNSKYFEHATSRMNKDIQTVEVEDIILTMENYIGSNEKVNYNMIVTPFKLSGASYFSSYLNNTYYTGYLSNLSYIEETTDINTLIREQVFHEFLHLYLNNGVYEQDELIEELASQKDIKKYVGEMYWNMPWHRAVDENIVRAVETKVYAKLYNNEDNAYREILQKEIEIGGFTYVDRVYQSLENYENNRDIYNDLELYIPTMIKELFAE